MITRQCVILAGGLGTRLGTLTKVTPKPLLPVSGRPFLETLLREAVRRGFDDIVLLTGYRAEAVNAYLEQSNIAQALNASIRVSVEPQPFGTAGALAHALPLLAEDFLLVNGDTWFDFNWLDLAHLGRQSGCDVSLALRQVDYPDRYETVALEGSRVIAFRQRNAAVDTGLINGGVYWMRRSVAANVVARLSLEVDVLPRLCKAGGLAARPYDGFFIDIGVPETYGIAQQSVPARQYRPAVFLDRDGVLNIDSGYVYNPDEFVWIDGAKAAVKDLNDLGYYVFVVTNQAGIAHGLYEERNFHSLKTWIESELRTQGASIDDWRYCPFHPEGKVAQFRRAHDWRKPEPGMIRDILKTWPVDLSRSFLIGDKQTDVMAATAAGLPGHLFQGGNLRDFLSAVLAKQGSVRQNK
jgi:D,D-heptose 1,7-bisphosphate phosphatase